MLIISPFQLASWIIMLVSFPLAGLVISTIKETNYQDEQVVYAEQIARDVEKPEDGSSTHKEAAE
jgi:hypothetical protein